MSFLTRDEIIHLFKINELKINDPDETFQNWAERDCTYENPFQQCSVDLHVGNIYVPETKPNEAGSAQNPKTDEHVLETGHTIMIRTKERITLPDNIGGICFSPSRLALKAILITNMGHVDPGYSGHLHFTAINMGRQPYTFRANDAICTMLLFKLSGKVQPYGEEYFPSIETDEGKNKIPGVIKYSFPRLAKDFVDVNKRAQAVAKSEINKAKLWTIGIPVITSVVFLIGTLVPLVLTKPWEKQYSELNAKIEVVDKKLDFEKRIKELEIKVSKQQGVKNGSDRKP